MFTFLNAGVFVLYDAGNSALATIVSVMSSSTVSPSSSKNIQPMTDYCLYLNGIAQNQNILLEPDWGLIFGLLAFILIGIPIIIGVLYYISARDWNKGNLIVINYKNANK